MKLVKLANTDFYFNYYNLRHATNKHAKIILVFNSDDDNGAYERHQVFLSEFTVWSFIMNSIGGR